MRIFGKGAAGRPTAERTNLRSAFLRRNRSRACALSQRPGALRPSRKWRTTCRRRSVNRFWCRLGLKYVSQGQKVLASIGFLDARVADVTNREFQPAASGLFRKAPAQLFSEVPIRAIEIIGLVLVSRASTEE